MPISYEVAANMALVLNYGGASQAIVAGLNKMSLPGLERDIITVQEFRNTFSRQFTAGGKQGSITYGGSYVQGDDNGQTALKTYLKNSTKFTDARLYINNLAANPETDDGFLVSDFILPDTYVDPSSAWQVSKALPGNADINGVIPYDGEIILNGQVATMTVHMTADTIAFVDSDPDTVTDTGSGFVTAGFQVGMTLVVEGTSNNDGVVGVIETVAAGTLTLDTDAELTVEAAGTDFTLHGGIL